MIAKDQLLEFAIAKFTKLGCKRFTLDDLAYDIGISKKTIYHHFSNKEAVVSESVLFLLEKIKAEIYLSIEKEKNDPILCIISIYRIGLNYLKTFSPTFLYGLEKYYPSINLEIINFRTSFINNLTLRFLKEAQAKNEIRNNINLELTLELYCNRIDLILFKSKNIFSEYATPELLEHLIINNLRGIATESYLKKNTLLLP
jgi:AcrR family transcriptional regulator